MGTLCLARVNTPQYFSTLNMRLKEFETSIVTGRDKGQNTDGTQRAKWWWEILVVPILKT